MALADTANLIVALKLDDKLSAPLGKANVAVGRFGVNTQLLGQGVNKVGKGLALGLVRGAALAAGGLALVGTQVVAGVKSLQELEDVQAQTVAGLKSTAGASGQTAESIRALAEEYETLGGVIDDKVIQGAENILLTFPKITKDAFEPALEAALNLSTRLGTDLNGAAIQVGKALADPIRGLTNLRRVGVTFTDDQQKLIQALVDENDLYGAQQIILGELENEFGGSFAKRGETQAATIGRMKDAIEELQKSLATAFIPVIDKVARKLNDLFTDQDTINKVKRFGETLAGFFTEDRLNAAGDAVRNLFGYLAQVPWGAIGQGLQIAGRAAQAAVSAFNALPKEVQGVVIAALAANKLTGGLVASGIGDIGKALFGGAVGGIFGRGGNPASPVFTKEVGIPGVGGGGAPIAGGGGTGIWKIAGGVFALSAAAIIAAEVGSEMGKQTKAAKDAFNESGGGFLGLEGFFRDLFGKDRPQGAATPLGQFNPANRGGVPVKVVQGAPLTAIDQGVKAMNRDIKASLRAGDVHAARIATEQRNALLALKGAVTQQTNTIVPKIGETNRGLSVASRKLDEGNARQRETAQGIREARDRIGSGFARSNEQLGVISRKKTSFAATVVNNITATLSTYQALQTMTRINQIRTDFAPGDSTGGSV